MAKKDRYIFGKPILPNAGIRVWYQKELNELTAKMDEKTRREVLKIWKEAEKSGKSIEAQERIALNKLREYFKKMWRDKATQISESLINRQNRHVVSSLKDSVASFKGVAVLGTVAAVSSIKTSFHSKFVKTVVKAAIQENVALIKSIPSKYFTDIEGAVYRGIVNGDGYGEIEDSLLKTGSVSKRRARNIAKDQSHKTYQAISRARMEEAGIEYWEWVHGGGTKTVRPNHIKDVEKGGLNHSIHKIGEKVWDKDALGKGKGAYIYPAELPFCSCRMRPALKIG